MVQVTWPIFKLCDHVYISGTHDIASLCVHRLRFVAPGYNPHALTDRQTHRELLTSLYELLSLVKWVRNLGHLTYFEILGSFHYHSIWYYSATHWRLGDVVVGNTTFYDFCCFRCVTSLHVAVNICMKLKKWSLLHLYQLSAAVSAAYAAFKLVKCKSLLTVFLQLVLV